MVPTLTTSPLQELLLKFFQERKLTTQDVSIVASVLFHASKISGDRILKLKELTPHMVHFVEEVVLKPGEVCVTAWNKED